MNTVSPAFRRARRDGFGWATGCVLALALVLTGALGCKKPRPDGPQADATAATLGPVPAPAELIAEFIVPNPERSWTAFRDSLGEDAAMAPRSVGGLVVSLCGLPLRAVQEFDEKLPLIGAVAGTSEPRAAVALHVRSGGSFIAVLTTGSDATFDVERQEGVAKLIPKGTARRGLIPDVQLAIVGNYLVIANRHEALAALGPFLVRTVAPRGERGDLGPIESRPSATLHSEGRVFGSFLQHWLDRQWAGLEPATKSRIALFIDLEVAAKALFSAFKDDEGTEASLWLGKETLRIDATVRVAAANEWAARPNVTPKDLGTLPEDTIAALAFAESTSDRLVEASRRAAALESVLSDTKNAPPFAAVPLAKALAKTLAELAQGRGDRTTLGARCTGAGLTGFATGEVAHRAQLESGLAALLGMRSEGGVTKALDQAGLELLVEKGRLELVTDEVTLLRLGSTKKGDPRSAIDLRFAVGDARYTIAAGVETVDTLQAFYRPAQGRILSELPQVRAALAAHGEHAFFAFFADPLAVAACASGAPVAKSTSPVTVSLGAAPGGLRLRIEAARSALVLVGRLLR